MERCKQRHVGNRRNIPARDGLVENERAFEHAVAEATRWIYEAFC
jgi:hypothetical protein